jgi:hypothetical protein
VTRQQADSSYCDSDSEDGEYLRAVCLVRAIAVDVCVDGCGGVVMDVDGCLRCGCGVRMLSGCWEEC